MPDWSYRPLFAPWMLRCPAWSHALILFVMRQIGHRALFFRIIDLLGHMRPPAQLRRKIAGLTFSSPVGLSSVIDAKGQAFHAFERFGYGYIEIGPVSSGSTTTIGNSSVDRASSAITGPRERVGVESVVSYIKSQPSRCGVPRLVRAEAGFDALAPHVDAFLVSREHATDAAKTGRPWGLVVSLTEAASLTDLAGASLIAIDPDNPDSGGWSPKDKPAGLNAVASLRRRFPDVAILYAAGGVESPGDAREFVDAGADLISLSHGFVFTGPGTPKRINEALSSTRTDSEASAPPTLLEAARYAWFWCLLLGVSMLLGGLLAGYFALTRVVLPYDESAAGITRDQIAALHPGLLHFMAHDRFTLAGTMISLGILYIGLAWFGVRRGRPWAQEAMVFSTFAGFLTFFTFLAYGYFDQFHAFVAAAMLPIAIQCAVSRPVTTWDKPIADLRNDAAWRRACVGQLCWVVQAVGLILAGATIMLVGSGVVFVDSDLAFLMSTRDSLRMLHPQLVPLIAHDRATFGGMLFSTGIAVLITTLWGLRRGERWLWWTLGLGGLPAYAAALWIHHSIHYTDTLHLSPVFVGAALHLLGFVLSARYLRENSPPGSGQ